MGCPGLTLTRLDATATSRKQKAERQQRQQVSTEPLSMLSTKAIDPVSAAVRAARYPPAGASWYATIMLLGALADRLNRRWVIYIGVSIWSIATMFCGIVHSFAQLLLARVGVGAGEAALNPCATSIIADLFPRERLTRAMAVYALGATVGSGTALVVGGAIVDAAANWGDTQWPLIGPIRYWQMVFLIYGVPGSLLALIVFSIAEPVRRGSQATRTAGTSWWSTYLELFRFMRTQSRFFIFHYVGFTLATLVITGNATWFPAHMTRAFGWSAGRIGLVLGATLTGAGIASKLICGWCVDAMYARGYRDAQLRWFASCLGIGTPIGLVATTSDNPYVFLSGVCLFMLCLSAMPACALTALNLVTPNELRGSGVAMWSHGYCRGRNGHPHRCSAFPACV